MSDFLKYIPLFILYVFFQVFLFNHLVLWNVATPFIFVVFLAMLPTNIAKTSLYAIAFLMGLSIDVLSDSGFSGLNAFSAVFAMAFREPALRSAPSSQYRSERDISLGSQPLTWYIIYLSILIFAHHFAYFFLEAFGFVNFFRTLLKIISSGIYTLLLSLAICIIFYRK